MMFKAASLEETPRQRAGLRCFMQMSGEPSVTADGTSMMQTLSARCLVSAVQSMPLAAVTLDQDQVIFSSAMLTALGMKTTLDNVDTTGLESKAAIMVE